MGNWTYWGLKTGKPRDAEDTKKCPVEKYIPLYLYSFSYVDKVRETGYGGAAPIPLCTSLA